ncbi:MAG: protein-glutamate O-methyltransferase CheR [Firmicutes bacterium]|nr:protein-glutamate O-methyltransferase CheR [Bacillota bacterium]
MNELTDAEFTRIRDYIKAHYGINMGDEKKSLIYSRLRATLINGGFTSFTQYFDYLLSDKTGAAIINFVDRVTTNHTFFMRETDHFDFFKNTVLPQLEEKYSAKKEICLWCAGCSSGEESNTLQMILQDYFEGKNWNTEILATDISTNVLDKAVHSVYPNDKIETLPENWRKKYFNKFDDHNSIVVDQIKRNITYRTFNLMEPAFKFKKKMHVIFCRNVMIYFDNETRDQIVGKFYEATEDGGYIFIGHSESLTHTNTKYKYIMPAVYRKL